MRDEGSDAVGGGAPGPRALGVVLAGGASRRFGSPKALARVEGAYLAARAADALRGAGLEVVLAGDLAGAGPLLGLPSKADRWPGQGPLGGIHTALAWAEEVGAAGALCLACDLPFVAPALLRAILARAADSGALAVAPEGTRDGAPEPLCAWYSTRALSEVEARLARGERSLHALLAALGAARLPLEEVAAHGDPARLFLNVNTPADLRRAGGGG